MSLKKNFKRLLKKYFTKKFDNWNTNYFQFVFKDNKLHFIQQFNKLRK